MILTSINAEMTSFDFQATRRRFAEIHSQLRNEGRNPLEAIAFIAERLLTDRPAGSDPSSTWPMDNSIQAVLPGMDNHGAALAVAFQQFLVSEARNGLGQYLTPLPVAELIAEVCHNFQPIRVLDPFVGSGILLDQVIERVPEVQPEGIEINEVVARVAQAVSALAGYRLKIGRADAFVSWVHGQIAPADAVVTNPPFGALATTATREQLSVMGVASELLTMKQIPAELLGLELSVSVLKPEGLLAIVLPQSVLSNSSWSPYRANLFSRIHPLGAVSLPEATFAPFRGVAKACILFAKKRSGPLPKRIPYFRATSIGYDDTGRATTQPTDVGRALETILGERQEVVGQVAEDGAFQLPPTLVDATNCLNLGDIALIFTGRTLPRADYVDRGPWLLKVGDLKGSFIPWRERPRVRIPQSVYNRHPRLHLQIGDICLTSAAHRPRYIGLKIDLIDQLPPEGAMASAEVLVIRLHPDSQIRPEQLLFYLRSLDGYAQLQDLVRGSTAHLHPKDVERVLIPPINEGTDTDRLIQAFWNAARAFRQYLMFEDEATQLGIPAGLEPAAAHLLDEDPGSSALM